MEDVTIEGIALMKMREWKVVQRGRLSGRGNENSFRKED